MRNGKYKILERLEVTRVNLDGFAFRVTYYSPDMRTAFQAYTNDATLISEGMHVATPLEATKRLRSFALKGVRVNIAETNY